MVPLAIGHDHFSFLRNKATLSSMLCSASLVRILSVEQTKTMEPAGGQSKTLMTGKAREWANMQESCTQRVRRYLSRSLSILLAQEGRGVEI